MHSPGQGNGGSITETTCTPERLRVGFTERSSSIFFDGFFAQERINGLDGISLRPSFLLQKNLRRERFFGEKITLEDISLRIALANSCSTGECFVFINQ